MSLLLIFFVVFGVVGLRNGSRLSSFARDQTIAYNRVFYSLIKKGAATLRTIKFVLQQPLHILEQAHGNLSPCAICMP